MAVPTSFNLFTVKPWQRNALVAVDGKLLFVLVDSYYGGAARDAECGARGADADRAAAQQDRDRHADRPLPARVLARRGARVPARADRGQCELRHHGDAERNRRRHARRRHVEGAGGSISLVAPLSSFELGSRQAGRRPEDGDAETRQRWRQGLRSQLEHTQLDLTTVFLETEISMRELLRMQPGDILPIEMPKTAILRSGARPLLRGKFGLSRGYNAVSVLEAVKVRRPIAKEEPR